MTRTKRLAGAALCVILLSGCGGSGDAGGEGTTTTTRSLLNQDVVGGPSTPVGGGPGLSSGAPPAYLPDLGYDIGSVEAPLKVIEFSDFGCGYCRRFHLETFPTLRAEFIETARIEWKFMPFVTGSFGNSPAVSEAAECVLEQDAGRFEAFSHRLWELQAEWKGSDEPAAVVRPWAEEVGSDMAIYDACLAEDRRVDRVSGATDVAGRLGIRGTPTFWLVGYGPLQGALPLEAFQGILGSVLEDLHAVRDSIAGDSAAAAG